MAPARAAPRDATVVRCELDTKKRRVGGQVVVTLANPTRAPLHTAYVWLYPNRLAVQSPGVTDVNYYWVYPSRFNPGSMKMTSVAVGQGKTARALSGERWRPAAHGTAGRNTLWTIDLPEAIAPGAIMRLTIAYNARIPERYDSFGCFDGACTLIGGFYPMIAAIDQGGWDLEAPPQRTDMDVTVDLTRPGSVVLFDQYSGGKVLRVRRRERDVPYASLFVAPRWFEVRRRVGDVELRHLSRYRQPPADDARGQILPYTSENYPRYALDVGQRAVELLAKVGGPVRPGTELTMVEVPLRQTLAAAVPRVVAVSDRWYRIWPARRFRKFHDRELVRALMKEYFRERAGREKRESARDIPVVADMLGAYLADAFTIAEHKKAEFAGDILAPVSFVPIVDQLLYAPQTMFASAYFGTVLDDEPLRDRPDRFMHQRPRGRLYYEKLRDLLSGQALQQAMRQVMVEGTPFRDAAEAAYGGSLDWFFRQWELGYPRVNYKLVSKETRRLGRRSFEHKVVIAKETAPADVVPVEPVDVVVRLKNGTKKRLRWDGAGDRTTFTFRADARIDKVAIDPRGRLVEAKLAGREAHPLYDNRDDHARRFVYNSFGVFLNVTDITGLLQAEFSLARVRDVKNEIRFQFTTSPSVRAGATVEYRRAFGSTIDEDTLLSRWDTRVRMERLNPGFFVADDEDERAGSSVTLGSDIRSDDRRFFFEPLRARALAAGASVKLLRRDTTAVADSDLLISGKASLRLTRTFTPRPNHTIALFLAGRVAFGDLRDRSQLLTGGGLFRLRGYADGELFGRALVTFQAEWRHWYVHDLTWNLGHYNIVRGVGGVAFVDVGALSSCTRYDLASKDSLYASAGYGLRFPYDSFGTLPFLMRVDAAVRLTTRNRDCLGPAPTGFPPVMVYVSFFPPF